VFESLADGFRKVFAALSGRGRLTEKNVQEAVRQVKLALLQADVNFKVVGRFVERVTQKAVGLEVIKGVDPTQLFVKIIHDELVGLMGPVDHGFVAPPQGPLVLMMVGLQGCGKTTTTGKLARLLESGGKKPLMVAADLVRPAAVAQLKTLGEQLKIPVYAEDGGRAVKVCKRGVAHAVETGRDVVLLDTQGRLHIDEELMEELVEIKKTLTPHAILLVADAMTGQDAVNSASQFHQKLGIDAVILTKLDGDARGGAAMSIKEITGRPIKFVGVGEKMDALEPFYPERIADRILGMGDIVSFVEKAQAVVDQKEAEKLREKIRKDELTLNDFYKQLQQTKKIGPLKELIKMLPGAAAMQEEFDEEEMKHMEAIIQSMTPEEREYTELLGNPARRKRIARGSGTTVFEVSQLLKQFDEARRMIRDLRRGDTDLGEILAAGGKRPKRPKGPRRR
jgi:signal recognition particle subunit SRP54